MKKSITLFALIVLLCACTDNFTPTNSIANLISESSEYNFLRIVMVRAGLTEDLNAGVLTLFAPNDAAFKASGFPDEASVSAIPAATCEKIMQYHILSKKNEAAFFATALNTETTMLNNEKTYISKKDNIISINGAKIIKADIQVDNGVVHAIDRVLLPPTGNILDVASANPELTFFVAAAKRATTVANNNLSLVLIGTASNTVFAPNNQAFIDLGFKTLASITAANANSLIAILNYHIIAGRQFSPILTSTDVVTASTSKLKIIAGNTPTILGNGNAGKAANVTQSDVLASNGVIHVIDRVLLP